MNRFYILFLCIVCLLFFASCSSEQEVKAVELDSIVDNDIPDVLSNTWYKEGNEDVRFYNDNTVNINHVEKDSDFNFELNGEYKVYMSNGAIRKYKEAFDLKSKSEKDGFNSKVTALASKHPIVLCVNIDENNSHLEYYGFYGDNKLVLQCLNDNSVLDLDYYGSAII